MNEFGKDTRLYVGDGDDPEVFAALGGETKLGFKRGTTDIDLSDKDSGDYGSTGSGQQKVTISVSGNLKLPDAAMTLVDTAAKTHPRQINVQVKKGSIIKFHGTVTISNFSADYDKDGPVPFSFDLMNYGAPIVDDLTAAA